MTEIAAVVDWVDGHANDGLTGITLSGGEPFEQPEQLRALVGEVRCRQRLSEVDVLVYSGYTYGVLSSRHRATLAVIDALISGPYVESKPSRHPWIGSSNQVLTLLTSRAQNRYDTPAGPRLIQVSADGGRIWITGVPRRGDLDRLEALLEAGGVRSKDVSWRS